ncbi:hypothetical protein [Providencia rettgeri]|uniref:hypothetical protein n=1 Tax=Providencia rettgeri TaxID=587 RepID=UPI00201B96FD|nr:hypothetical protein [Providencia rettgeri]
MMELKPTAILIHVPDVQAGLAWYQQAFPQAKAQYLPDFDFTLLYVGDFTIEVVQADKKVSEGKKGQYCTGKSIILIWLLSILLN